MLQSGVASPPRASIDLLGVEGRSFDYRTDLRDSAFCSFGDISETDFGCCTP